MKKIACWLLLVPCCALAQFLAGIAPVTGTITSAGATCAALEIDSTSSGPSNCVSRIVPSTASTASIVLTGTFTATVQFELSADNGRTWVAAPTASVAAAGTTNFGIAGYNAVRARSSAYTSGTIAVTISIGTGSAPSTGSGFPVTAAQVVNTGGSISPGLNTTGQIFSTGEMWTVGAPAPSWTMALTTGNFLSGHAETLRLSLNTVLGETQPGQEITLSNVTNGCTSGTTCNITVTAPTIACGALPCGGFTGYTVYQCDSGVSAGCPGSELKVGTCSNITTNCTFGSNGAGAAPLAVGTAFFQPTPQAADNCPPGVQPNLWANDFTGNWYDYVGLDAANTGTNPPGPYNKLTFCRPTWFNDSKTDPPLGKNAMVLMFHLQNGAFVNAGNQDRGQQIFTTNCIPEATCTDAVTHYALEGIQVQQDLVAATPLFSSQIDSEVTAGSFQTADSHTGVIATAPAIGINAVRATTNRNTGAGTIAGCTLSTCWRGATISAYNNSATAFTGNMTSLMLGPVNDIGGAGSAAFGYNLFAAAPANRFTGGNVNIYIQDMGANAVDLNIESVASSITRGANNFQGPLLLGSYAGNFAGHQIYSTQENWIGGLLMKGGLQMAASATPANPAIVTGGTPGSTTNTYAICATEAAGGTVCSGTVNITTANANLTGTNFDQVQILSTYYGADHIDIYRTAAASTCNGSGCVQGKIGTRTICNPGPASTTAGLGCSGVLTFNDTGLVGDGSPLPAGNTTGAINSVGLSHLAGNLFKVASNFTTANNTSLQTITGLSMNLPGLSYSFHCAGTYSQAAALAAVAFGIQSSTATPTNIFANGVMQVSTTTPFYAAPTTLATLTTTTATNITSGTPGVIGTNYTFQLDGTIELPTASGGTINIMVSTATGADAVTVLRGSYCQVF